MPALEEIFRRGKLYRSKCKTRARGKGKVRIYYKHTWLAYHRLIWMLMYPDDPILGDEDIHHWDGNPYNNDPLNLVKLKMEEHRRWHRTKTMTEFMHPIELKRRKGHMGHGQARLICRGDTTFHGYKIGKWVE